MFHKVEEVGQGAPGPPHRGAPHKKGKREEKKRKEKERKKKRKGGKKKKKRKRRREEKKTLIQGHLHEGSTCSPFSARGPLTNR